MSVAAVIPSFGWVDKTATVTQQQLEAQGAPAFTQVDMDRFAQHIGDQCLSVDVTLDQVAPAAKVIPLGSGDLLGGRVTTPPAAHWLDIRDGTASAPAKIGTSAAISRTDATTRAEVDAMGPTGTDGPDGATGFRASVKGLPTNEVQVVAGFFSAWQTSTYSGNGNDACAHYAFGRSTGTGRAIGGYVESRREGASSRGQQGYEFRIVNEGSKDDVYAPGGFSDSMGLEFNAAGTHRAGTVIEVGFGFGQQFDTAIAAHPGSVYASVLRDDSESQRSVFIGGTHSKGAIVVKAGNTVVLGREEPTTTPGPTSPLLELFVGEGVTLDPALRIGGTQPGVNASTEHRNSVGTLKQFISAGANNFLPGTAAGDSGVQFTPGKTWHVGAVGKAGALKVAEASLAFFGHALGTQQTVTGSRGGNAALASLLTALAAYGLVIDSTTA